jgi:hypothetical protein
MHVSGPPGTPGYLSGALQELRAVMPSCTRCLAHRPVKNVVTPVVTPIVWYNHVTPLLYHFDGESEWYNKKWCNCEQ